MTVQILSAGRTDIGKVRKHNEDAILLRDDAGLWVVADGLGGHTAGDYASGLIVERLGALQRSADPLDFVEAIEDALTDVNHELVDAASQRNVDIIGSTVVLLVQAGDCMICGWVGDSRAYCFENGRLRQLTTDHVHGVKDDVTQFGGSAAQPQAGSGVLSRAVGAEEQLFIDWLIAGNRPGMQFLLCSDGINKEMSDQELDAEYQRASAPEQRIERLFDTSLGRAGRDNISAVTVQLEG